MPADQFMQRMLEWCKEQKASAEKGLKLFESGTMRMSASGVDISEEHKATLRRVISDMDELIAQIERDAASDLRDDRIAGR